jgi:hypothetical protein
MKNIETQSKLLKYKGILNDISHISYSYKELNRTLPYIVTDPTTAEKLLNAYKQLITDAIVIIRNFEKYEVNNG